MALGEQLREARRGKEQTQSQVAAATRMKVQIVEALEAENFACIPAPIYAKGFIRLYAEHVGLDPEPLIREYVETFVGDAAPSLKKAPRPEARKAAQGRAGHAEGEEDHGPDLFSQVDDADATAEAGADGTGLGEDEDAVPAECAQPPPLPGAWSRLSKTGTGLWTQLVTSVHGWPEDVREWCRDRGIDLSKLTIVASPGKAFLLMCGLLVIFVFVISGLSQCVRKVLPPPGEDRTEQPLVLAVDPPDTYLD